MTKTLVTCDRCRSPIESGRTRLVVEGTGGKPPLPVDQVTGRPSIDLCSTCLACLASWLSEVQP